jgi:tungstate transport system ATP-binding protein
MPLIEIKDLHQSYHKHEILKNINLSIEKGEIFTLIGPTGAGKTTLLRLIDLLDIPSGGSIRFDDIDIGKSNDTRLEMRRRMAFVLQKPVVFNTSVYENVAYGLKWRNINKEDIRRRVDDILEIVELSDYTNRKARTLSGGEVQRVAIARAIAIDPELLILDEPTANLDPMSARKVEQLISNINKQKQTTIIIATHDMAQVQRLADRVSIILDGEIQQTGYWQDILNSPRNADIAYFLGGIHYQ